jgi:site-specific DNA-cytosine methylase
MKICKNPPGVGGKIGEKLLRGNLRNLKNWAFSNQLQKRQDIYLSDISFKMFKSEEHGVPQIRRRVIVIGTRLTNKKELLVSGEIGKLKKKHFSKEELNRKKVNSNQFDIFNETETSNLLNPVTVWDAISDLPSLSSGENSTTYSSKPKNDFQKTKVNCKMN